MHFLIFMFMLVPIACAFLGLLGVVMTFWEDITQRRWKWIPLHLVAMTVLVFTLHHFVDLMVKFVNA